MAAPPLPEDLKARLKASYDSMAPKYNEWTIPQSVQRLEYLDKTLKFLPSLSESSQELRVLELGCGCGLPVTQKLLSYPNVSVVANDISSTQINLAKHNLIEGHGEKVLERVEFVEGDMNALSFPTASLDVVLGLYSIIHLPREEQVELLEKITGWLKPGGYFLANFAQKESESVINEEWLDEKGWMFWSSWGQERTIEFLQSTGLHIVVGEVTNDVVDTSFLWIIARK